MNYPYRPIPDSLEFENRSLKEINSSLEEKCKELAALVSRLVNDKVEQVKSINGHDKWEYKGVKHSNLTMEATEALFSRLGKEGWELVSVVGVEDAYFKRRIFE